MQFRISWKEICVLDNFSNVKYKVYVQLYTIQQLNILKVKNYYKYLYNFNTAPNKQKEKGS